MSYNSGVIVFVISNRPRATRSADLKSGARLLPELYSTQSYYHYLSGVSKKSTRGQRNCEQGQVEASEGRIPFLLTRPPSRSPLLTSPKCFVHPRPAPSLACLLARLFDLSRIEKKMKRVIRRLRIIRSSVHTCDVQG